MVVVPINVCVPDDIYESVLNGDLFLYGMVKDKEHLVRKHLPTIKSAAEAGVKKAAEVVANHKKEAIIVTSAVAVVVGIGATVTCLLKGKAKKEVIHFNECLERYYTSIKEGTLDACVIDNLLDSLTTLEEKNIKISISPTKLSAIVYGMHEYTSELAKANHSKVKLEKPKKKGNSIIDIRDYLEVQKEIIISA